MRKGYDIGDEWFDTKEAIRNRCREIVSRVEAAERKSGAIWHVREHKDIGFLLALFSENANWATKQGIGVSSIYVDVTNHDTRCFCLVRKDESMTEISWKDSVRDIPSGRKMYPKKLLDFKEAARNEVSEQRTEFMRDFYKGMLCPVTKEEITASNVEVDHIPPAHFDTLLFNFCTEYRVNPLHIELDFDSGTGVCLKDPDVECLWYQFHLCHKDLRFISKRGNQLLPKPSNDWYEILELPDFRLDGP